jgi:hypothetical protein
MKKGKSKLTLQGRAGWCKVSAEATRKEFPMGVFVSVDGSYGQAEGLVILPDNLTEEEMVMIQEASDNSRIYVAYKIMEGR